MFFIEQPPRAWRSKLKTAWGTSAYLHCTGSSATANDALAHADAALQQLRHMVREEASSSSANKQLIGTALNKKEQELQACPAH